MDTSIIRKSGLGIVIFLTIFFISASMVFAQENCSNGIDDDGDGFIDCYDSNCSQSIDCADFFMNVGAECEALPTAFPAFTIKKVHESDQNISSNHAVLVVGDLLGDKTPEVVVANTGIDGNNKTLSILSGTDLSTIKTIVVGKMDWQEYIAIAKIDKADCGYIFLSTGSKIIAYDCNLNKVWETGEGNVAAAYGTTGPLNLIDFNSDGKPELYYKNEIRDALTGAILVKGTGDWLNEIAAGSVAVDVTSTYPGLELINGLTIYEVKAGATWSLNVIKENTEYFPFASFSAAQNHNYTSVADYDLNGELDIIANGAIDSSTGNPTVFLWLNPMGGAPNLKKFSFNNATHPKSLAPNGTGIVNIANIDNVPGLNCTFAVDDYVYALDENFNYKWRVPITENSSGNTGTTVFDFNGDGQSEIVYRDENYLYIIQDENGTAVVKTKFLAGSQTGREYPIVADVNNDGETEILVTSAYNDGFEIGKTPSDRSNGVVRMFASDGERWVRARSVWNQHAYFNVNINDDLTIPIQQQKHFLSFSSTNCQTGQPGAVKPLNSFLNQSPYLKNNGCPSYASPDFTFDDSSVQIQPPTCPNTDFTLSFKIVNQGDIAVTNKKVYVSFYNGAPLADLSNRLNTDSTVISLLNPGESLLVENLRVKGTGGNFTLYVRINDPKTLSECNPDNNTFSRPIVPLPFNIGITKISDNHRCTYADLALFPDNGEATAHVLPGELTAGYEFKWFKNGVEVATGYRYSGMAAGDYTVSAIHTEKQCSSNTASVTIGMVEDNTDVLAVVQEQPFTNCSTPDGALKAVVTIGGVVQDPANYSYKWYRSEDIEGIMIRESQIADKLLDRSYSVDIVNKTTGCKSTGGETVKSEAEIPDITEILTTPMQKNKCNSEPTGAIEIKKAVTNKGRNLNVVDDLVYKYYYNALDTLGSGVPSATTYKLEKLVSGVYGVIGILKSNGCPSSLKPAEVKSENKNPNIDFQVVNNTSCDVTRPNGTFNITKTSGGPTPQITIEKFNTTTNQWQAVIPTFTSWTIPQLNINEGLYRFFSFHSAGECMDTIFTVKDTPTKLDANLVNASTTPQTNCATELSTNPYPNGALAANYAGQTANYTFNWYKGTGVKATTDYVGSSVANIPAMGYTLQVIDNLTLCKADPVYPSVAHNPDNPVITTNISPNTSCDPNVPNGRIIANATSAIAPPSTGYQFAFLDGTTALTNISPYNQANGLAGQKTYTVRATNPNSLCSSSASVYVGTSAADIPVINTANITTTPNTICVGTGDGSINATNAVSGDPDGYTFHWYDVNGNLIAGQTGPTLSALRDGTYRLGVTKISSSCPSNGTVSITVAPDYKYPQVTLNVTQQQAMCAPASPNGELTANAAMPSGVTAPAAGFSFTWYKNSIAGSTVIHPTQAVLSGQTAGTYKVLVTNENTKCFTESPSQAITNQVIYPDAVAANVTPTPNVNCAAPFNGQLQVVSPNANHTYRWYLNNVSVGDGTTMSSLNGATYQLRIFDNTTQCLSQNEKLIDVVNQPDLPVVTATPSPNISCDPNAPNGSISASATSVVAPPPSGYVFSFFNGATQILTNISPANQANALTGATYTVYARNDNTRCESSVQSTVNNEPDTPVVDATAITTTPNTICVGTPGTGSIDATAAVTGNVAEYLFQWYDLSGNLIVGQTGPTLSGLRDGTYGLRVQKISSTCISTSTTPITVAPDYNYPQVNLAVTQQQVMCDVLNPNGELTATAAMPLGISAPAAGFSFRWYKDNVVGTTVIDPAQSVLSGQTKGTYKVLVTNEDTKCFTESPSQAIIDQIVYPDAIATDVTTSPNTHCTDITRYTGSITVNSPNANYTYQWYRNSSHLADGISINDLQNATYQLKVFDNTTGCLSQNDKLVTVGYAPIPVTVSINVINQQTHCSTDPTLHNAALLAVVAESGSYTYDWRTGQLPSGAVIQSGDAINGLTVGWYNVNVVNTVTGCTNYVTQNVYHNRQYPVVTATATEITTCDPFDGTISANVAGITTGHTFVWTNDDWGADRTGPSFTLLAPGTYSVYATVDSTQCRSLAAAVAEVLDNVSNNVLVEFYDQNPPGNEIIKPAHCEDFAGFIKLRATNQEVGYAGDTYNFEWYYGSSTTPIKTDNSTNISQQLGHSGLEIYAGNYNFRIINTRNNCVAEASYYLPWIGESELVIDAVTNAEYCKEPYNGSIKFHLELSAEANANSVTQAQFLYLLYAGSYQVGDDPSYTNFIPGKGIYPDTIPGFDPNVHLFFDNLPAGHYTLAVVELWSTKNCNEKPMTEEIEIGIDLPKITSADVLTVDFSCDNTNPKGELTATAGSPNTTLDANGYTFTWYETDYTGTHKGSGVLSNADKTSTLSGLLGDMWYAVRATNDITRCDADTILFLPWKERDMKILDVVSTPQDNCTTGNGSLLAQKIKEDGVETLDTYTLSLFKHSDPGSLLTNGLLNVAFADLRTDKYIISAQNDETKCETQLIKDVEVDTINPHIVSTLIFHDQYCDPSAVSNGAVHVAIDESLQSGSATETAGYTYEWTLASDPLNILYNDYQLTDRPSGDYKVRIVDNAGKYMNCAAERVFTISENNPSIAITKIATVDQTWCVGDNGSITVQELMDNGVAQADPFTGYTIQLLEATPVVGHSFTRNAGTYQFKAIHNQFLCESPIAEATINLNQPNYVMNLVATATDYSCNLNGKGELEANVLLNNTNAAGTFTFNWYEAALGGTAIDPAKITVSGSTSTVVQLKGNQSYAVQATQNVDGCDAEATVNLPWVERQMVIPASMVVTTPQDDCLNGNGTLLVREVRENNVVYHPGISYTLSLARASNPTVEIHAGLIDAPFTGLFAGQYVVSARNLDTDCVSPQFAHTVAVDTIPPQIVTVGDIVHDQYCAPLTIGNGAVNVAVNESSQGGSATQTTGYTFEWFSTTNLSSSIHSSPNFTDLPSGNYLVRVQDIQGKYLNCRSERIYTINENTPNIAITKIATVDQTDCIGLNGSVTVEEVMINGVTQTIPNGDYTVTLLESTPVVGHTFVRGGGTYQFRALHNTFGCESNIAEATINVNHPIYKIQFTSVDDFTCNTNGQGSLSAVVFQNDVQMPNTEFTFNWWQNDPANSLGSNPSINQLLSGQYNLSIVDNTTAGLGCTHSEFTNLQKIYKRTVIASADKTDQTICAPNGTAWVNSVQEFNEDGSVFNGGFTFTYSIRNSNGDIMTFTPGINGTAANPFDGLGVGAYTLFAENGTTGCLSEPFGININDVSSNPSVALTVLEKQFRKAPPAIPSGELLATMNPGGTYDIVWYHQGLVVRNETGVLGTDHLTNGYGGRYLAVVTNQATLCEGRNEIDLPEEISTPELDLSSTAATICLGDGTITINNVTIAGDVQPVADYRFVLYRDFVVPINQVSEISGTNPVVFNNLTAGTYYVIANHIQDGLTTEPTLIEVVDNTTSPDVRLASLFHQSKWSTDVATHNGSISIMVIHNGSAIESNNGNYTVRWYAGENQSGTLLSAFNDSFSTTGLTVGRYTAAVTENATGCTTLVSYTIEDRRIPVWVRTDSNPNTMCVGANGSMSAADINPNTPLDVVYNYYWYALGNTPNADYSNALYVGQRIENVPKGMYIVYMVDVSDPDRKGSAEVEVGETTLKPTVVVSQLTPQRNCDISRPTGSLSAELVSLNHSEYEVTWYDAQNLQVPIKVDSWDINGLAAREYTVRVTNKITGCFGESKFSVAEELDVVPVPTNVIISHRTNCAYPNGEISTSVGGTTNDYTFKWYFGPTIKNNIDRTGIYLGGLEIGGYTVTATRGSSGCTSNPITSDILDKRINPEFEIVVKNANCMEPNGKAVLTITNDVHVDEVLWTDGYSLFYGETFENQPSGTYQVKVTTREECTTSKEVTILPDIMIYNGISANGDGANDIFKVGCIDQFAHNNVKIFNRAGDLVYETNFYDNEINFFEGRGNRGLYLGKPELPVGTYFYIIDLKDGSRPRSGYLELTR